MPTRTRYARLLGSFHRHPKTEASSNAVAGVYAKCLAYSADNQTDGHVPASVVESYCRSDGRRWRRTLEGLTVPVERVGCDEPTPWLHRTEHGYRLHDYTEEQITKARSDELRGIERDRKRTYRVNESRGVSHDVPTGQTTGQPPGQDAGHASGHPTGQPAPVPSGPPTDDAGLKTQDSVVVDEDNARAQEPLPPMPPQQPAKPALKARRAEGESVAKVFNAAFREAATRERGELTPGNMYPYVAHREEFDGLAILCRSLGGEDWPVFIKWWWRSTKAGGWAAARLTVATPKALLKAWQSNVAEWRDPERFAAERKRSTTSAPDDPRLKTDTYKELPE